ncbi:SH3 domain-containing protein [Rhodanobacter panaciterrae]|nr:SH3 domain-containing protein [Rhodanobacter panaciterrae]
MKGLTRFALASLSLASLSLALPALAYAQDGFVTGNVNLRAGPDPSYPLVDQLPAGTGVSVQGCTDGWEWCDVINDNDGNRGWIAGNFIQYDYQDQPVLLSDYGAQIGIPIVAFTIGTYWDHYYRSRPFYRERETWYHRDIPRRPPPRHMDRPYAGRPMSNDDRQRHGSDENRREPQYQRPAQTGTQQQRENNAQRYGANENRPAPQYQRPAQAGAQPQRENNAQPQYENNAQRHGANENRPAPQYQRAEQASVPQQRGPNPGARPQQQAAPARGEAQAHGGREGKPAEHKKDDHADNGGH